jgi:predicted transposase YdaD
MELITTIVLYKFTKLSREEVLRMLGFTTEELKRTRFYQEIYAEAREEGLQEGRREGRREGREEGRQEGLQEGEALVVLRLLRRRFGSLPHELEEAIRQLSSDQIEALAEALLDFTDLGEVVSWLERST